MLILIKTFILITTNWYYRRNLQEKLVYYVTANRTQFHCTTYTYIYMHIYTYICIYIYIYTHTHTFILIYILYISHLKGVYIHHIIYTILYIYTIYHHWRILRSSYRKLAWVRFEPRTTEFRSATLIEWAFRSWVHLALRANFAKLLQFHCLFSARFYFGYWLRQLPRWFWLKFCTGNHMSVAEWTCVGVNYNNFSICTGYILTLNDVISEINEKAARIV